MQEKIKVLSIVKSKTKVKKGMLSIEDCIDQYAPGMYTYSDVLAKDAIKEVDKLRPEIIWITQDASTDYSDLVKEIKRIHPAAAIFMMFAGVFDDEQELTNTYLALGVYKCYFIPPLILDTLAHDMYVALNLE